MDSSAVRGKQPLAVSRELGDELMKRVVGVTSNFSRQVKGGCNQDSPLA